MLGVCDHALPVVPEFGSDGCVNNGALVSLVGLILGGEVAVLRAPIFDRLSLFFSRCV